MRILTAAPAAEETDCVQILAWYDDLLALTGNPIVALSRAVAAGEVDGPLAGLAALGGSTRRWGSTTGSTPWLRSA